VTGSEGSLYTTRFSTCDKAFLALWATRTTYPATEALRRLGHDVVTLHELGKTSQALIDQAVLDLACADTRCSGLHVVFLREPAPAASKPPLVEVLISRRLRGVRDSTASRMNLLARVLAHPPGMRNLAGQK
jgi:hypothetical protein